MEERFNHLDARIDRVRKRLDNLIALKDEQGGYWEEFEREVAKIRLLVGGLEQATHDASTKI